MAPELDVLDYQSPRPVGRWGRRTVVTIAAVPTILLVCLSRFLDPGTVVLSRLSEWERDHEQRGRADWVLLAAFAWLAVSGAVFVGRWLRAAARPTK